MISDLRVERFKCFEDQTITFGKLTLLAGNNGTGKSTVIQALLLLRQAFVTAALQKNELPLNGDLVRIGTSSDAIFAGSREDTIIFTLGFDEYPNEKYNWVFAYDKEMPGQHFMVISKSSTAPPLGPFAPRLSYLMAERWGPRIIYPMSELPRAIMDVGVAGEFVAHCLAEFGAESITNKALALDTEEKPISLSLEHQAQLWMRKIIPDIAFTTEPITKADRVRLGSKFFGDRTDYLRPTNMGFGVAYSLPIIVAALMAEPNTVLMIENPEAHLHPAGQSQIGQFLSRAAEGGLQVIVESHSDHVLNGIRIAVKNRVISEKNVEIEFFSRSAAGINVTKPTIYQDGGISNWPEGFFDQFERDLKELF